ncbi:MAG: hypothetical protein HY066_02345 [Betaproteobacteria bacterium]|nr:hypothetical protein [Betaproteobacteria bacterium]
MTGIQRQAGLNQLEFSMALVLLALIWLAALNRLHELQEIGEKTAVEMTIRNIQSGLRWETSERIITGREASIVELAGSNPVRWLEKPPDGYLGEFSAPPEKFSPGNWYFDTLHRELRYLPVLSRNLECRQCEQSAGEMVLSWRIARVGNPMFGPGDGVRVVVVTPYRWF